jgi:hypothetical protein
MRKQGSKRVELSMAVSFSVVIQFFEIWIDFLNQSRKFVVLIVLREVQNDKNNIELFS